MLLTLSLACPIFCQILKYFRKNDTSYLLSHVYVKEKLWYLVFQNRNEREGKEKGKEKRRSCEKNKNCM